MRSSLTALGIAVAVASFIALVGISRGLEQAWINSLLERGTHMLAVRKGAVELLTASIDESVADELRRIDGVRAVAGELVDLVTLESGHTALVTGWSPSGYLWQTLRLHEGNLPSLREPAGILVGQAAAEALGKEPRDTIRLRGSEFVVTGTFKQTGVMGNNTIVLQLSAMQDLVDRPGKVTEFNLRLDRPDDPERVAAVQFRLSEAFPDLLFTETREIADNNDILRLLRAMAWSTSTIALVMALVVVLNTLLMSVMERTHEIGVLSAIGWQAGRILAMIVMEGLILAMIGSAVGSVLGIGGLTWLASLPQVRGFLEPEVTPRLVLEVSCAALFLGVLGSLYPAWRAVRLNPVDALKYE